MKLFSLFRYFFVSFLFIYFLYSMSNFTGKAKLKTIQKREKIGYFSIMRVILAQGPC